MEFNPQTSAVAKSGRTLTGRRGGRKGQPFDCMVCMKGNTSQTVFQAVHMQLIKKNSVHLHWVLYGQVDLIPCGGR